MLNRWRQINTVTTKWMKWCKQHCVWVEAHCNFNCTCLFCQLKLPLIETQVQATSLELEHSYYKSQSLMCLWCLFLWNLKVNVYVHTFQRKHKDVCPGLTCWKFWGTNLNFQIKEQALELRLIAAYFRPFNEKMSVKHNLTANGSTSLIYHHSPPVPHINMINIFNIPVAEREIKLRSQKVNQQCLLMPWLSWVFAEG